MERFLNYCKEKEKTAYFSKGTYILPTDFQYNYGRYDFKIKGDGKNQTILTTKYGQNTVKYAKRIDLTQPKPVTKGVYRIEILGPNLHADWKGFKKLELNNYIELTNAGVRTLTLNEVKKLGYVTDVDITLNEPLHDGIYVVSNIGINITGAFHPKTLPWEPKVKVLIGTLIKRINGKWSTISATNGFQFSGDAEISDISFNDVLFYLFTPLSDGLSNRRLVLKNCSFSECTRVFSLESGSNKHMKVIGRRQTIVNNGLNGANLFDGRWTFREFRIQNCDFDNIHTSILWFTPPSKEWIIQDNTVAQCHNTLVFFHYLTPRSVGEPGLFWRSRKKILVKGNTIKDCRNYSKQYSIDRIFFRTPGNAEICSNSFINCVGGIRFYVSGPDNRVYNNHIEPFNYFWSGNSDNYFLMKNYATDDSFDEIFANTMVGGVGNVITLMKNHKFIIYKNTISTALGMNVVSENTNELDLKKIYTVKDLRQFKLLAGNGNYVIDIQSKSKVFYNQLTHKWENFSAKVDNAFISAPRDNIHFPITVKKNEIQADYVFEAFPNVSITELILDENIERNLRYQIAPISKKLKKISQKSFNTKGND